MVCLGFDNIVKILIDNGANVNAKDSLGETPLSVCAYKGYEKIAEILIRAGAHVNHEVDNQQCTVQLYIDDFFMTTDCIFL